MVRPPAEAAPTPGCIGAKRSVKISIVTLDTLKRISIQRAVSGRQPIGVPVNVLKNNMFFAIDTVTGTTKQSPFAGPSEEVAAAVLIRIGKGMKKMTGNASQLAIHKGHVIGQ